MAAQQTQSLMQTEVLTLGPVNFPVVCMHLSVRFEVQRQQLVKLNPIRPQILSQAHPTYDCCYVPETNLRNGAVKIAGTNRRVMPGMFCHMMVKGLPSSKWPMIRMGSLREAGVASVPGLGAGMLAKHQLHHCRNDIIFKTQHVARLLSLEPASI